MNWGWVLILLIIAMLAFRLYCSNNVNKGLRQIFLPIVCIVSAFIVYFIIAPLQMRMSLYDIYIYPKNKWLYSLSVIFIIILITQSIDLYKQIKNWGNRNQ